MEVQRRSVTLYVEVYKNYSKTTIRVMMNFVLASITIVISVAMFANQAGSMNVSGAQYIVLQSCHLRPKIPLHSAKCAQGIRSTVDYVHI